MEGEWYQPCACTHMCTHTRVPYVSEDLRCRHMGRQVTLHHVLNPHTGKEGGAQVCTRSAPVPRGWEFSEPLDRWERERGLNSSSQLPEASTSSGQNLWEDNYHLLMFPI